MARFDDSILREIAELRNKIYRDDDEMERRTFPHEESPRTDVASNSRDLLLRPSVDERANERASGNHHSSFYSKRKAISGNSSISEDIYSDDLFESDEEEEEEEIMKEEEIEDEFDNESDDSTSDVELRNLRKEVRLWEEARQRVYSNDVDSAVTSNETDNSIERYCEIKDGACRLSAAKIAGDREKATSSTSRGRNRQDRQTRKENTRLRSDLSRELDSKNSKNRPVICEDTDVKSEDEMSSSSSLPSSCTDDDDPLSASQKLQNEIEAGQSKINELRNILARLHVVGKDKDDAEETSEHDASIDLETDVDEGFVNNLRQSVAKTRRRQSDRPCKQRQHLSPLAVSAGRRRDLSGKRRGIIDSSRPHVRGRGRGKAHRSGVMRVRKSPPRFDSNPPSSCASSSPASNASSSPSSLVVDKTRRLKSWQNLGLVPWSNRDERRKRREAAVRKNYGKYFKMIEEGVDAKEIERRMKKKFIGSTVIDIVVKESKDRARERRRNFRRQEEVALMRDAGENILDSALGDALSLLIREERDSGSEMAAGIEQTRKAASAARIAAAFAIASVASVESFVSSSLDCVATAKSEFIRLKKMERTALLGEIRHAREMERERKKQQYRGVPLHKRNARARRRNVHRKRRKDLERRMVEAAHRNFDSVMMKESAIRKRVSDRIKKMKSLVDRDRRSRALVREKIQKIDAERARRRQEDSDLRSFWKSLIGGDKKRRGEESEFGGVALDSTSKAVVGGGDSD